MCEDDDEEDDDEDEKDYDDDEEADVKSDVWSECMFWPLGTPVRTPYQRDCIAVCLGTAMEHKNLTLYEIVHIVEITRTMTSRHDLQFCKKR